MGLFAGIHNMYSVLAQAFPPKPQFNVDQIPDLTGSVILVTGGNTGIGRETCKVLLQHNAKVYLAARNKDKAEAAITDLKASTGKEALFLELDLSSLASVKKAAKEFLSKEETLHILFNNAGVMMAPIAQLSTEGYDLQFGTNVVGPFYFTKLLMPALLAAANSSAGHHARIITTSSGASYMETLNYETFKDSPARRKMRSNQLYRQSKFANVVVARQFAKRYADSGIVSISVNPGNIQSDLYRYYPKPIRQITFKLFFYPVWYGALTQLWAGTMPEAVNYNGEFAIPWARPGKCREEAYDPKVGEQLWDWLEEQVKDVKDA